MKTGDLVKAETFGGATVDRQVVELEGDTIYICKPEEWRKAREEGREPVCVGFNKRYIRPVTAK